MDIANEVHLGLMREWLRRTFILLDGQIDASGQLSAAQKNLIKTAIRQATEQVPVKEWDFFIRGDRHVKALNGGILRLPDGSRLLLALNPLRAWTSEEWEALNAQKRTEAGQIEAQLASLPQPKTEPDEETLAFWNSHVAMLSGAEHLQASLEQRRAELAELEEA